ncbi:MAG: site-2 protease family protein [Candidatus Nanopelagicales bacterium]|jgi:membrane-associated protease RseP (regulator of RpoE activity)|nr:site-2 protease family protein [Candidatus Nanopelagicales bacterium]
MDTMLFVLGVLLAGLFIGLSIGLHEVGHMVPAKRFGVRVPQYMVGFGPTLWSKHGRETEYGIKWIPLGGYIRMIGMFPPPKGAPEGTAGRGTTGRFQMLAEEARTAAWEEVQPGDEKRVFYRLSAPKKVVVMLGGPTMNLLLAVVFFFVLLVGIGIPTPTTTVAQVGTCVPSYMATPEAAAAALADPASVREAPECGPGDEVSPAVVAGIVAGDRITAINGQPVSVWSELTDVTRASPGQTVVLGLETASGPREVEVPMATAYRPVVDDQGFLGEEIVATGYIGVTPQSEYVAQPISAVPATMWDVAVRSGQAMLTLPVRVYELAQDMIAGEERDPESPVSVVGVGRISGEVVAAEEPVKAKFAILISLMASLNLFLFLFNLLPVLPLDGGHVLGATYEGARRTVARWRGRPDPGPVDVARLLPVSYGVGIALIAVSSVVILADVINPISIYG